MTDNKMYIVRDLSIFDYIVRKEIGISVEEIVRVFVTCPRLLIHVTLVSNLNV